MTLCFRSHSKLIQRGTGSDIWSEPLEWLSLLVDLQVQAPKILTSVQVLMPLHNVILSYKKDHIRLLYEFSLLGISLIMSILLPFLQHQGKNFLSYFFSCKNDKCYQWYPTRVYFHLFSSCQDKPEVFVARNGKQLAHQPDDRSVQKFHSFAMCEKLRIENRRAYSA